MKLDTNGDLDEAFVRVCFDLFHGLLVFILFYFIIIFIFPGCA